MYGVVPVDNMWYTVTRGILAHESEEWSERMKSVSYWKRLLAFSVASVLLVIPFRFLTVNAVVKSVPEPDVHMNTDAQLQQTGDVYDGVLMKMTDLSYSNLDAYVGDSLLTLEDLAAVKQGPPGIYQQVDKVNQIDWHLSYDQANSFFFSDLAGWKILAVDDLEASLGFYAVAFQRGNTVVIAYRGTDNVMDLVADAGIYLSVPNMIEQLQPAEQFFKRVCSEANVPSGRVILTGHSMGGWLAQKVYLDERNAYTNWKIDGVTVFNSIGTGFQPKLQEASVVKDYHFDGDVFSHYGSSLGIEIDIPNPNPDESVYDRHQMYDFYGYFYPGSTPSTTVAANIEHSRTSM
ncbi:Mbeg1-like protein [Alicyclobacillus sacchari]|nr:Mbeg1-like protein [Alicyclobacillus sacchari]